MGIPRKSSRRVEFEDHWYRYLIRTEGPLRENLNGISHPMYTKVTVQEDVLKPGRVLQHCYPYGTLLGPNDIRGIIQWAREKGWNPSDRGPAFKIQMEEV